MADLPAGSWQPCTAKWDLTIVMRMDHENFLVIFQILQDLGL